MSKFQLVFEFTNEDNRDDFLTWMCDGGGECTYMDGQLAGDGIKKTIDRFDYTGAFPAWGYDGTEPPVVQCQTEDEIL